MAAEALGEKGLGVHRFVMNADADVLCLHRGDNALAVHRELFELQQRSVQVIGMPVFRVAD